MIKYIISILALFLTGCVDVVPPLGPPPGTIYNFELNLGLEQDSNGYYHLPMIQEGEYSTQSFYTLKVETNNYYNPQMVYWICDTYYEFEHMGFEQQAEILNENSYTNSDGTATTILGPHMEQVGDTVSVLVGYTDSHTFECYALDFKIILD